MKREYPDHPIVGVGAIIIKGEEVLLARRGRDPGYGEWSIPGGGVKLGETLRDAVIREVREEVNLAIRVGEVVEVLERIFHDPKGRVQYHYVLVDFLCEYLSGEGNPSSDALEVRWVPISEIPHHCLPGMTKNVIQKAFEMRQRGMDNEK
ncbi:MAG: NUDIX hydrolase [Syntrophobacterales bacterium]|nr:MAG: NUDIX hydrolase [Syntrophobacterales bacterium]